MTNQKDPSNKTRVNVNELAETASTSLDKSQKNATDTERAVQQVISLTGEELHKDTVAAILNDQTIDKFNEINISISGTGSFYPKMNSILGGPRFMSAEDLAALQEKNVVGDIALRFFDKDGNQCETDLVDRMISIDFDQFKRIPTKITIASGIGKAYTVLSALKGKLIDVLIIDYELGMEILRLHKEETGR